MKKNNKKNSNRSYNVTFDLPDIVDMETLSYAGDDELSRRLAHLNGEKEQVQNEGYDAKLWEVEIAYVQRELKIRNARRVAHDEYLKANPEPNYYELTYVPNYDDGPADAFN